MNELITVLALLLLVGVLAYIEYLLFKKAHDRYLKLLELTIINSLVAWEQIKHEQISSFSVEGDVQ